MSILRVPQTLFLTDVTGIGVSPRRPGASPVNREALGTGLADRMTAHAVVSGQSIGTAVTSARNAETFDSVPSPIKTAWGVFRAISMMTRPTKATLARGGQDRSATVANDHQGKEKQCQVDLPRDRVKHSARREHDEEPVAIGRSASRRRTGRTGSRRRTSPPAMRTPSSKNGGALTVLTNACE